MYEIIIFREIYQHIKYLKQFSFKKKIYIIDCELYQTMVYRGLGEVFNYEDVIIYFKV